MDELERIIAKMRAEGVDEAEIEGYIENYNANNPESSTSSGNEEGVRRLQEAGYSPQQIQKFLSEKDSSPEQATRTPPETDEQGIQRLQQAGYTQEQINQFLIDTGNTEISDAEPRELSEEEHNIRQEILANTLGAVTNVPSPFIGSIASVMEGTTSILGGLGKASAGLQLTLGELFHPTLADELKRNPEARNAMYDILGGDTGNEFIDDIGALKAHSDKHIVDLIADGNIAAATEQTAQQVAGAIPSLVAAAFGPAGLAAIGISAMGNAFDQTLEEHPDEAAWKILGTSFLKGGYEVVSEYATRGLLKKAKLLVGKGSGDDAKEYVESVLKETFKGFNIEGLSEGLSGLASELTDMAAYAKEADWTRIIKDFADTYIVGGLVGAPVSFYGAKKQQYESSKEALADVATGNNDISDPEVKKAFAEEFEPDSKQRADQESETVIQQTLDQRRHVSFDPLGQYQGKEIILPGQGPPIPTPTGKKIVVDERIRDELNKRILALSNKETLVDKVISDEETSINDRESAHQKVINDLTQDEARQMATDQLISDGFTELAQNAPTEDTRIIFQNKADEAASRANDTYIVAQNYPAVKTEADRIQGEIENKRVEIKLQRKAHAQAPNPNPVATHKLNEKEQDLNEKEEGLKKTVEEYRPGYKSSEQQQQEEIEQARKTFVDKLNLTGKEKSIYTQAQKDINSDDPRTVALAYNTMDRIERISNRRNKSGKRGATYQDKVLEGEVVSRPSRDIEIIKEPSGRIRVTDNYRNPVSLATENKYLEEHIRQNKNWTQEQSDTAKSLIVERGKDASDENHVDPITRAVVGRKIDTDSYKRYGDPNNITHGFARAWLKKGGEAIDLIAQEVESEIYGDWDTENPRITPDDIIEIIESNPNNYLPKTTEADIDLTNSFIESTGLPARNKILNTFVNETTPSKRTTKPKETADTSSTETAQRGRDQDTGAQEGPARTTEETVDENPFSFAPEETETDEFWDDFLGGKTESTEQEMEALDAEEKKRQDLIDNLDKALESTQQEEIDLDEELAYEEETSAEEQEGFVLEKEETQEQAQARREAEPGQQSDAFAEDKYAGKNLDESNAFEKSQEESNRKQEEARQKFEKDKRKKESRADFVKKQGSQKIPSKKDQTNLFEEETKTDDLFTTAEKSVDKAINLLKGKGDTLQLDLLGVPKSLAIGGLVAVREAIKAGRTISEAIAIGYQKVKGYVSEADWANWVNNNLFPSSKMTNPEGVTKSSMGKLKNMLNLKGEVYGGKSPYKLSKVPKETRALMKKLRDRFAAIPKGELDFQKFAEFAIEARMLINEGRNLQRAKRKKLATDRSGIADTAAEIIKGIAGIDPKNLSEVNIKREGKKNASWINRMKSRGVLGAIADVLAPSSNDDFYGLLSRIGTSKAGEAGRTISRFIEETLFVPLNNGKVEKLDYRARLRDGYMKLMTDSGVSAQKLRKPSGVSLHGEILSNEEAAVLYSYIKDPRLHKQLINGGIDQAKMIEIVDAVNAKKMQAYADGLPNVFSPFLSLINAKLDQHGFKTIEPSIIETKAEALKKARSKSAEDILAIENRYNILEKIYGGAIPSEAPYTPFFGKGYDSEIDIDAILSKDGGDFYTVMSGRLKQRTYGGKVDVNALSVSRMLDSYESGPLHTIAYLDFAKNASSFFSSSNLEAAEGTLGEAWKESLVNSLQRIITGRNVTSKLSPNMRKANQFMNWSIGNVMFLNARSAILQQVSRANFSFNNASEYAQYALSERKKVAAAKKIIFNSPYIRFRGEGGTDIVTEEMLKQLDKLSGSREGTLDLLGNNFATAVDWLGNKGYILTKVSDKVAIAGGGAPYMAWRIDVHKDKGLSEQGAIRAAYKDFVRKADEAQQSTSPDRIGKFQSSWFGRYVMSFTNAQQQLGRVLAKQLRGIQSGQQSFQENLGSLGTMSQILSLQATGFAYVQKAMWNSHDGDEDDEMKRVYFWESLLDTLTAAMGLNGLAVTVAEQIVRPIVQGDPVRSRELDEIIVNNAASFSAKRRSIDMAINGQKYLQSDGFIDGKDIPNWVYKAAGQAQTLGAPAYEVLSILESINDLGADDLTALEKILRLANYSRWDLQKELGLRNPKNRGSSDLFDLDLDMDLDLDIDPLKKVGENQQGELAQTHKDGTIEIDPNLSPEVKEQVMAHERVHQQQLASGQVDYMENSLTWAGSKHRRRDGHIQYQGRWVPEGDPSLPWEADANAKAASPMKKRTLESLYNNVNVMR